jgi:hypothetical protein
MLQNIVDQPDLWVGLSALVVLSVIHVVEHVKFGGHRR